jgi:hypothetical protein
MKILRQPDHAALGNCHRDRSRDGVGHGESQHPGTDA